MLLRENVIAGTICGEGRGVLAGLGGAIVTFACVASVPTYNWTSAGMIGLGSLAAFSGALMFTRQVSRVPIACRQILGAFLVVYGASAVGGGIAGHTSPTTPLLADNTVEATPNSHWKTATAISEGNVLINTAIASNQRTLILWTVPDCKPCSAAMELGVLNPSVNPALAGYRLINIQSPQEDSKALMDRFGATGLPSLTLMGGSGVVPEFGRINNGIDAISVMDMLELQNQADNAER